MTDEFLDRKLLVAIAGTLRFQATLTAAQHMFGRSYFSLHSAEKAIVHKAVSAHSNYEVTDQASELISSEEQEA